MKKIIVFILISLLLFSCKKTDDSINIDNKMTFNADNIESIILNDENDLIIEDKELSKALEKALNNKVLINSDIRCNCAVFYTLDIKNYRLELNRHSISILSYNENNKHLTYLGSIEVNDDLMNDIFIIIQNNIIELI